MKKLIELCVRRPVGVVMFTLFLAIIGLLSLSKLKLDLYPNINLPYILVMTTYEGAGSEEIENLITRPLESAISAVPNVKKVSSTSSPGSSMIIAECNYGANLDFTNLKMRERIDLVKRYLPTDAEDPILFKLDPSMMPIVYLGFSSPKGVTEATRLANDKVKVLLERIPGVASVSVMGGLTREIKVSMSADKMAFYKVSPAYLAQALRGENINLPGGTIKQGHKELVLRTIGEFQSVEDLKNLKITLPSGSTIPLRELAEIQDSYHDTAQITRIKGENSILILVSKESDANTVLVTREVRKVLNQLEQALKGQASFHKVMEQAEYIEKSLNNLIQNAVMGALLAIFVLYFFLRSIRSTLIISVAIPTSIIITFAVIYFSNMTLNLVSMGGLALGVGMLVDNAIVALEVIHRYREEGYQAVEAATEGASEIAMAITSSTLTTIVVFVPVIFVEGITAQIFREMALTVTISLVASLAVALTVVPMLSAKIMSFGSGKKTGGHISKNGDLEEYKLGKFEKIYRRMLGWAVQHRRAVIILAVVTFFLGFLPLAFGIKTDFMASMGEKRFSILVEMPLGTNLNTTDAVARNIEAEISKFPDVDSVFSIVGSSSSFGFGGSGGQNEQATVMVSMKESCKRDLNDILEEVRMNKNITVIPGAKVKVSQSQQGSSFMGGGAPVAINIEGPDIGILQKLANQVKEVVKSVPGTREVETSWQAGRPEYQLRIDRQRANFYGLSPSIIAGAVQTCFQGSVATRIRLSGEEYDVLLRLKPEDREKLTDLEKLYLLSSTGASVPLSEVVRFTETVGPNRITRDNQTRQVQVTAQFKGMMDVGKISAVIDKKLKQEVIVPSNYNISFSGKMKEMGESFLALFYAFLLAVFLVYMVIAVQYENLVHPLAILGTLPLTVFGVTWSLFLTGRTFDVSAFIGVIMLAGIVVNNAIVLVDYIETLRNRGLSREEAILKAGPTRLRPVLMTTLTTILGLIPLAIGIGEGSEMNVSMATVVIGGLTFCTVLTLVIIPVVYSVLDDWANWMKRKIFHRTGGAIEYHR